MKRLPKTPLQARTHRDDAHRDQSSRGRARPTWIVGCVVLALAGASVEARADDSERVAAESLFAEGRDLMRRGELEAACEKFASSQSLDPALGTLLNLAACHEKTGRTASAWAEFRSAAASARQLGDTERERVANQRAKALEPRLSRLTIVVRAPDASVRVVRNGEPVAPETLGNAIPVDPGPQIIRASADGRESWSTTVDVAENGVTLEVLVPALAPSPASSNGADDGPRQAGGSTQRTLAWISGGVGLAGLGVGTFFGLRASSSWSDAKAGCEDGPYQCSPAALDARSDANTQAWVANAGFALGAVGLALGAVLLLTDDEESSSEVVLAPTGAMLRGRF